MNDYNEGHEDLLHLMLEMLKHHNTQLSHSDDVELNKQLRGELMSDNSVAILMLESVLFGKPERSIN